MRRSPSLDGCHVTGCYEVKARVKKNKVSTRDLQVKFIMTAREGRCEGVGVGGGGEESLAFSIQVIT